MKNMFIPFGLRPKLNETGPRYGDMYERGLAAAIDVSLIFLILNWLFSRITIKLFSYIDAEKFKAVNTSGGVLETFRQLWEANMLQMWSLNFAVQVVIIGIFYVSFQIVYATTPGKWLLGLKVVRHGTHEPLKPWRYVLRYIAYFFACTPLMLGVFWASFNKKRRGWHDYIAGTDVISTRPRGWYYMQAKRGIRHLRSRWSAPKEEPVAEPAAEQGHQNGKDAVE